MLMNLFTIELFICAWVSSLLSYCLVCLCELSSAILTGACLCIACFIILYFNMAISELALIVICIGLCAVIYTSIYGKESTPQIMFGILLNLFFSLEFMYLLKALNTCIKDSMAAVAIMVLMLSLLFYIYYKKPSLISGEVITKITGKNSILSFFIKSSPIFLIIFIHIDIIFWIYQYVYFQLNTKFILSLLLVIMLMPELIYVIKGYISKESLENELKLLQESQSLNNEFINIIRSQRHDFLIHVHTISGLLAANQIEECNKYVHQLVDEVEGVNYVMPVANPAIAAMLIEYVEIARKKHIHLDLNIKNDLSNIICSEYEVNRIIGNMIQNAIDEVETYDENHRYISLLIIKRGGFIVIKTTNSFLRDPKELSHIFDMNYSTKEKHEGIGLKNANHIVNKYSGALFMELDDSGLNIVAQLPNKYYKENE